MDNKPPEGGGKPLVNRDEPIPVIRISAQDDESISASDSEAKAGKRERFWGHAGHIKDKFEVYSLQTDRRQSLQDRVFATIMAQVIPSREASEGDDTAPKKDRRSKKYVDKPEFGPRIMANNFRRFNTRIGVVFVLENRMIHLFSWKNPAATLSFLAVYSLLCLKPHIILVVPLLVLLLSIMIPSFLARHPTPANDPRITPSFHGPPTAPASRVRPVPDLSTDFWRNMRDLQNSMEDFSRLHDAANEYITPYTNFSDEARSSTLFLVALLLSFVALAGSQLVPWRAILLFGGWALTAAGHPVVQKAMLSTHCITDMRQHIEMCQTILRNWADSDIVMHEPPELREVEVFELQKYHASSDTWESWMFSPLPYDPRSPSRIEGQRPQGTQFFEDVQAPSGWSWKEKKWTLDLFSRDWVEQRIMTGVEIETEGERWVYDLAVEQIDHVGSAARDKDLRANRFAKPGVEEGSGTGKRGEWRRRRWTRLVEKKSL